LVYDRGKDETSTAVATKLSGDARTPRNRRREVSIEKVSL
jgi:hypothetical protein